jgi:hypothetical protein
MILSEIGFNGSQKLIVDSRQSTVGSKDFKEKAPGLTVGGLFYLQYVYRYSGCSKSKVKKSFFRVFLTANCELRTANCGLRTADCFAARPGKGRHSIWFNVPCLVLESALAATTRQTVTSISRYAIAFKVLRADTEYISRVTPLTMRLMPTRVPMAHDELDGQGRQIR